MKMRKSAIALLTGISLAAVAPAQAATFTNGDYSLNFNGISESYSLYPDPVPGLAATLDLTVSGAGTDSWTLVYKLSNLSDPSIWEKTRITRSEEHTSELQSLMRISYAVFCLKKQNNTQQTRTTTAQSTYTHTNKNMTIITTHIK